jgi:hypothetical protein
MIKQTIGAGLALLFLSQPAFAQDSKPVKHSTIRVAAVSHDTLDGNMAQLAAKAAFQPSAQPTQQELLSVILLMSLREQRANHT